MFLDMLISWPGPHEVPAQAPGQRGCRGASPDAPLAGPRTRVAACQQRARGQRPAQQQRRQGGRGNAGHARARAMRAQAPQVRAQDAHVAVAPRSGGQARRQGGQQRAAAGRARQRL